MTSLETIKKLILYAETKRRLRDPEEATRRGTSVLKLSTTSRRLRKELMSAGISPELLDLSGDDIAQVIAESLTKRGY